MKTKRFAPLLLLAAISYNAPIALGQAPVLQCVNLDNFSGDITLAWDAPAPCAGFGGYLIYASQQPNTGFTLLHTETNPALQTYLHDNAAGLWYYYLQTLCNGQASATSDTLDSAQPLTPDLDWVSVVGDEVELHWTPSLSPETYGYLIIYQGVFGLSIIDTVFGRLNTTYLHTSAQPQAQAETYTISTLDSCGVTGLPSPVIHQTMHASLSPEDYCVGSILLQWTDYVGWDSVGAYLIYIDQNGSGFEIFDTLSGNSNSFLFEQTTNGDTLTFYVQAVNGSNPSLRSNSNIIGDRINMVRRMDYLRLLGISVDPITDLLQITWEWDTDTDVEIAEVVGGQDIAALSALNAYTQLNQTFNSLDAVALSAQAGINYAEVRSMDVCSDSTTSGIGSSIFLEVTAVPGFRNRLVWNAPSYPYGEIYQYRIYGGDTLGSLNLLASTFGTGATFFEEELDPQDESHQYRCYRIEAEIFYTFPSGVTRQANLRSNTACVEQSVQLLMPNAFAPEGVNREFKPAYVFGDGVNYSLQVYNRWGEQVFISNNIAIGWDGTLAGGFAPQGIYSWQLRYSTADGKEHEQSGTVMLLR